MCASFFECCPIPHCFHRILLLIYASIGLSGLLEATYLATPFLVVGLGFRSQGLRLGVVGCFKGVWLDCSASEGRLPNQDFPSRTPPTKASRAHRNIGRVQQPSEAEREGTDCSELGDKPGLMYRHCSKQQQQQQQQDAQPVRTVNTDEDGHAMSRRV